MKVLHLISGGTHAHLLSLMKELNKQIEVDLICRRETDFSREVEALGIPITVFSDGFSNSINQIKEMIRVGGYDLVHCHGNRANYIGSVLKRSFDMPFVCTVYSDCRKDYHDSLFSRMTYGTLSSRALRKMDYRICLSEQMRSTLIERGFDPNDIFSIHNSAELSAKSTCLRQVEIYNAILKRRRDGRTGVVICGSYGHGNAGDEAILTALIRQLHGIDADMRITVVSKNPAHTLMEHDVHSISRTAFGKFRRELKKSKLYINGGGSLIQDVTSRRSLFFYLYTIQTAKSCGCLVQMYGCGIGPLNFKNDRRLSRRIIENNVDAITLRDPESIKTLREIGVTKPEIFLGADPVLGIGACDESDIDYFMRKTGLEPNCSYVCLSLRPWAGFIEKSHEIAAALDICSSVLGFTPVFLPMNYGQDLPTAQLIASMLKCKSIILPEIESPELAIGLMSRMKLVVAMRLHTLLYAACSRTNSVGISYDPKVVSFADYAGIRCIDFERVNTEDLAREIRAAYHGANYSEYMRSLAQLKASEKINIQTARRLLEANEGDKLND